jgi:lysophospholipase L1-like esterase
MKTFVTRAFWVPVAVLVFAEAVIRLFFAEGFTGRFDYGYLPAAGFVEVQGGVELRRTGGRKFYPQAFAMPKPEGRLRIFTVGDSVTRGDDPAEAYPAQLERALEARGHDAESFNLGLTAYGATRKRIVALQCLRYEPDLIVLHVNEANEGYDERDWNRAQSYRSWHPRNWFLKSYALHRLYEVRTDSIFWKYLPEPIRTMRSVRTPDAAFAAVMDDPATLAEWNRRTRERTAQTVQEVTAAGVPMILVSTAYFRGKKGTVLLDDGLDAFVAGLAGPRVRWVSTRELMAGLPREEYFTDSMHLSPAGHRRLAERFATLVQELVPAPGDGP